MKSLFETTPRVVTGTDLKHLALFRGLDPEALDGLARHAVEVVVAANDSVIEENTRAEAFFVVLKGALAVFRDAVGQPVQLLARLHAGDFFGELGLFSDGRSMASVRASETSHLLKIDGPPFLAFADAHPELQLQLQMAAARRHSHTMASTLELGRRREVRVRCDRPVVVELEDGRQIEMLMENLSLGGICLSGVPASWLKASSIPFALVLNEGRLELRGVVSWRRESRAGLAFVERSPRHDMLVQMMIRLILEARL